MAKAPRKPAPEQIDITDATMITLDKLELSNDNVRHIKTAVSIETLAEDIARRGLLQSLSVRMKTDDAGTFTGTYVVQAGGRRLRALQMLAKKKRLATDAPIPCIIKQTGLAIDDSLAENTFREALHPLDQFRAFAALRENNISDHDIAATYNVTPAVVRQRLKLSAASPVLLKAYETDAITLDVLMAFCVTDDHKRQQDVYASLEAGHNMTPYTVRRMLTETSIEASDERALFIGLETYKAAGGAIMEDLFKHDSGPWLEDPDLLNKLVDERLQTVRADILAKGFKWAEICVGDNIRDIKRNLGQIDVPSALSKDDKQLYDRLSTECEELIEKRDYETEDGPFTDADHTRLAEIESALADLDNRPPKLSKKDIARSGVLISLSDSGHLSLDYGFLKPEDVKAERKAKVQTAAVGDNNPDLDDDDEDDEGDIPMPSTAATTVADKLLSDALVRDLTSFRTVALQNAVAQDFNTAFLAALHAMCSRFFSYGSTSCVQISPSRQYFSGVAYLDEWPASKEIEARHDHWSERLTQDHSTLWDSLAALSTEERADLFAHCVSLTIDAVHGNRGRGSSAPHTDQLARAVSLDMKAAGWTTTADNYFDRISKPQILDAVKQTKGAHTAGLIDHLKKPVMAKEAQRLIADTDWLPDLLRYPDAQADAHDTADRRQPTPDRALPAFLAAKTADHIVPANDVPDAPAETPEAAE